MIGACCFSFIVALLVECGLIFVLIRKKKFLSASHNNTNCEVILATDTIYNISYGGVNDNCKCKDNVAYGTLEGSNSTHEVIGP